MKILGITRTVASLEAAKQFYEEILGFEPEALYEPTQWQSYKAQPGVFYAVGQEGLSTNEVAFGVPDVEAFYDQIRDRVEVVEGLQRTPWGTYRFVIRDPDGNLLAIGQE